MDNRPLDATAANVIAVYPKIQQVLNGEIPTPEVAEFFITNYCSFRCPHCRCAGSHEGEHARINLDLFTRTADELIAMGCRTIEFGGGGEPLEHPQILEILKALRDRGMRCGIITNGYPLIGAPVLRDAILPVADWVRISLDAVTDETYRKVHGRADLSYQNLRAVLRYFSVTARQAGNETTRTRLGIKLILQQYNQAEIPQAFSEALFLGADYLQFKWLENHPFSIPLQEREEVTGLLLSLKEQHRDSGLMLDVLPGYGGEEKARANERCLMSILHPLIDWDGSVYICAFFQHRKESHCLGDLKESTFRELWFSQAHKDRIAMVNTHQCVPNCPLKRYNPVIDYIRQEGYRFRYI